MTYDAIAQKHGITASYVGQLSRGEKCPDVAALIEKTSHGFEVQAKRLGRQLARLAMARLGSLAAADSKVAPETQRKAAVDILAHALGDPSKPEISVQQNSTIPGVAPEDVPAFLAWQTSRKGGPDE